MCDVHSISCIFMHFFCAFVQHREMITVPTALPGDVWGFFSSSLLFSVSIHICFKTFSSLFFCFVWKPVSQKMCLVSLIDCCVLWSLSVFTLSVSWPLSLPSSLSHCTAEVNAVKSYSISYENQIRVQCLLENVFCEHKCWE